MKRFKSRKFLISVAAFLGSLGTSITGLVTDSPEIAAIGTACMVLSAAIYAGCEAYVDAAAVEKETTTTTEYTMDFTETEE